MGMVPQRAVGRGGAARAGRSCGNVSCGSLDRVASRPEDIGAVGPGWSLGVALGHSLSNVLHRSALKPTCVNSPNEQDDSLTHGL